MFDTVSFIDAYVTKTSRLSGTIYRDLIKKARRIFHGIEKQSKRKPYIRSIYFNKDKVFFDYFWEHLNQKSLPDRARRLRYFPCAIELVKNAQQTPTSKESLDKKHEIVHRFIGITSNQEIFYVQIKENQRTKKKDLMSIFPLE